MFNTSHLLQGTSADQDNRFSDKEKKLLNSMRFEESLAKKVDMKKVSDSPYIIYCLAFPKRFTHIRDDPSMSCTFGIIEDEIEHGSLLVSEGHILR